MHLAILFNDDHQVLEQDPGREAREDVVNVAAALGEALESQGAQVELVAADADVLRTGERLRLAAPDLVVNLCESLQGDSRGEMAVPALLDLLGLPYTGSGSLALGLALHKDKAKELLVARGVPTPSFALVSSTAQLAALELPFPLIVKPAREDASAGIDFDSVVHTRAALSRAVAAVLQRFQQPALVEQFIDGREVYVPMLGNQPREVLPLTEIRFGAAFEGRPRIVSYRAKWEPKSPECRDSTPELCALAPKARERVVDAALRAFDALGCVDYGRVDVRLASDGRAYVIDINPNCDLHPEAGFARAAQAAGLTYPALAQKLVEIALERKHGHSAPRPHRPPGARRAAGENRNVLSQRGAVRARAH